MSVPLVDMHEWIDRRLGHRETCLQFWLQGRPGRAPSVEEAHEIDCMAAIRDVLRAVNDDPKVFAYMKAKGVVS